MPRSLLRLAILLCVVPLAACQLALPGSGLPGSGKSAPAVSPVAGGEIEVTPLDAVPAAQGAAPVKPEVAAAAPEPEQTPPAAADVPAMPEAAVAPPAAPKLEAEVACERKGGAWMVVGKSKLRACVKTTRDSGKECQRQSQCESQCLARSGTCAPLKPLLGCNEVLQENGARVTLCID